jgi:hypothetical protein
MTDTASSELGCRTVSGRFVVNISSYADSQPRTSAAIHEHAWQPTSERLDEVSNPEISRSSSSEASSSISVVSVPFDVTGDGPTMSLGLITCIDCDEILLTELGRREAESVRGGGEELQASLA